ncbi:YjjG family noncanonical pyrimidine nucleotidase [Porphyromonas pogonae]|uniref:YjjG family noncanonical pyrimidine nucleotidase n=1 Tax=Porphyromonas pogonae TaxID=867595 RepID=UPI002E766BEF|nr:YjjG family noncanonical pyrimidine nucleotidase [Porphyromonas pogonae]
MIKNIFIDLDDTLWDTYHNNKESLEELFDALDWGRYYESFETFFSIYMPHNEYLWGQYRQGNIDKSTLIVERFRQPLKGYLELSDHEILSLNKDFLLTTGRKTGLCEGAIEVMEYLHRYYKVYILSNGFREIQQAKLHHSGLEPYVHQMILSEDAGINKPHKKIFDFALMRTASRRTESIMIGDSWEADIIGAHQAQLPSVWYNPKKQSVPAQSVCSPLHIIEHLTELTHIF